MTEPVKRIRQTTKLEEIFASDISDKRLCLDSIKNAQSSIVKKETVQLVGKRHKETLLQVGMQVANKHMKSWFNITIREIKI